jgi:superfamily II DNA or RNA helicase
MDLQYKIEKRGHSLIVRIEQQGSRRLLYLDTLKTIAKEKDQPALALLIRIHLRTTRNPETLTFDRIEVPAPHVAEAIRLMRATGRMLGEVEVEPEKPLEVFPRLVLSDTTGCFANLWIDYEIGQVEWGDFSPTICGRLRLKKEEAQFEKDLIDAGYSKKIVGNSQYYCPKERVRETLLLLSGLGWQIRDVQGKAIRSEIDLREEKGRIAIRGQIRGLIDFKLQMDGVWEGEVLYLKKSQVGSIIPLLGNPQIQWEDSLLRLAEGLKQGASLQTALPAASFKGELLPYQQKGVDWLNFLYHSGFSGLLADEMGLGKTVQVLAFLSRLGTNLPVLIVAPTSLLFNWRAEIDRFLPGKDHFVLISYTSLRINEESYLQKEFAAIVLDESNAIKTATTQTARAAFKLKGRFKICLNGTPMENRPDEIWSQFHFLMPDLIERNVETLKQQMRPFILRRKKEDVQLDLPEKIEQITWIEMEREQKELYDSYQRGIRIDGASKMEILETILRLRQISCDPRLIGSEVVGAKIQQLILDIEEGLNQKRKILIFSQFTSMLQLIRKEFSDALYLDGSTTASRRGELVQAFQEDPNSSLFLLSLKAGGVGLNLTSADYVFLVDPWWNEAVERQAIDRAHRIGQKKTVLAKRYLALGTIEEKMLQLKGKKQAAADQLLDFDGGNLNEENLAVLLDLLRN